MHTKFGYYFLMQSETIEYQVSDVATLISYNIIRKLNKKYLIKLNIE